MQFKKNKIIYIFLKNKIISLDTILPIILEVKKRNYAINIHFITFDFNSYQFIKKNILLYKIINEIGNITCLGREKNSFYFQLNNIPSLHYKRLNYIKHIITSIPYFIKLIYNIFTKNVIFIHFVALNTWPLKILYYLNRKNTIFSSSDSSGYSTKADLANRSVHEQRVDPNLFSGPAPMGKKVISFSCNEPLLKHPSLKDSKKYIIKSSHSRKHWINYLKNNFENMIEEENGIKLKSDYCLLILGHIGVEASAAKFLKNKNSWTTLVENILDIIHSDCPDLTIVIKPHIITDMNLLQDILSKRKNIKTVMTSLHPALLSVKAKFSIASHYSTAFQ